MLGALTTFLLIGSLLQGALCGDWKVIVPQKVEVVKGSCVTIPCSFDLPDSFVQHLNSECKAIWKKKINNQITIRPAMTVNLTKKDCTSTFNNMIVEYSDQYYFRLECPVAARYDFKEYPVNLTVTDHPPAPNLTPSHLEVKEGSSVSLTCSAPAPCQTHPPTLTWTPSLGDVQEQMQENEDKTEDKKSVLTFTASHLHHGQNISCTVVYKKQDGSRDASESRSLTAAVSYSPKNTTVSVSPSGPVQPHNIVTLTCRSDANPAVKTFTWYRVDESQKTVIGTGAVLKVQASEVSLPIFCEAANDVGDGRSDLNLIDVQYSPKNTTVSVSPSGPVQQSSNVTLTCRSDANPAVKTFTWYRDDGSQETVIGTGAVLNIQASEVSRPFLCEAANDVGVGRSDLSQIDVQYSPKNTTVSVSPSSPVQQSSNVTLTCRSDANPAVKTFTWYRDDGSQETVIGTGAVLNIQASEVSGPFLCEAANNVGVGRSDLNQIDVQFPPQILPSSNCTKTAGQINCSCETVGNPVPTLDWYLDGKSVSQSDKFVISNERLNNDKGLKSSITVSQQQIDSSILMCRSFNSLGSASQQFCLGGQASAENQDQLLMLLFISTTILLFTLVCVLLYVIRILKNRHNSNRHCTGKINQIAKRQHVTTELNEVPNTTEEHIYVNTKGQANANDPPTVSEPNGETVSVSGSNNAERVAKSSEKNDEGGDVVYSTVSWKSKNKKGANSANMNPSGGTYLDEEKSTVGGVMSNAVEMGNLYDELGPRKEKKEAECEYAQVKIKGKRAKKQ